MGNEASDFIENGISDQNLMVYLCLLIVKYIQNDSVMSQTSVYKPSVPIRSGSFDF